MTPQDDEMATLLETGRDPRLVVKDLTPIVDAPTAIVAPAVDEDQPSVVGLARDVASRSAAGLRAAAASRRTRKTAAGAASASPVPAAGPTAGDGAAEVAQLLARSSQGVTGPLLAQAPTSWPDGFVETPRTMPSPPSTRTGPGAGAIVKRSALFGSRMVTRVIAIAAVLVALVVVLSVTGLMTLVGAQRIDGKLIVARAGQHVTPGSKTPELLALGGAPSGGLGRVEMLAGGPKGAVVRVLLEGTAVDDQKPRIAAVLAAVPGGYAGVLSAQGRTDASKAPKKLAADEVLVECQAGPCGGAGHVVLTRADWLVGQVIHQ